MIVAVEDLIADQDACQRYGSLLARAMFRSTFRGHTSYPAFGGLDFPLGAVLDRPDPIGKNDILWTRDPGSGTGTLWLKAGWVFALSNPADTTHDGTIVRLADDVTITSRSLADPTYVLVRLAPSYAPSGDTQTRVFLDPGTGTRYSAQVQVMQKRALQVTTGDWRGLIEDGWQKAFYLGDAGIDVISALPPYNADGDAAPSLALAVNALALSLGATRGEEWWRYPPAGSIVSLDSRISALEASVAAITAKIAPRWGRFKTLGATALSGNGTFPFSYDGGFDLQGIGTNAFVSEFTLPAGRSYLLIATFYWGGNAGDWDYALSPTGGGNPVLYAHGLPSEGYTEVTILRASDTSTTLAASVSSTTGSSATLTASLTIIGFAPKE